MSDMSTFDNAELLQQALSARRNAYAPYSHFQVGAVLITAEGQCFSGCNIENASYSLTVCAERSAIFGAVSAGFRQFRKIAIVGGMTEEDARALLVSGFADNVSKELPVEYAVEMNNLIQLEMKGSIG